MSWTPERIETLRKLWIDGLSATEIADALQNGITRMAVIEKVHRLGLSGRAKAPKPGPEPKPKKAAPKPAAGATQKPTPALPKVPPMRSFNEHPADALPPREGKDDITDEQRAEIAKRVEEPAPASQNVTIMELRESMCRWPQGDPASPAFRYCGGDAPIGQGPYCKFHAGIAYVPSKPRKPMSESQKEAIRRGLARSKFGGTLADV